eukprot:scaffold596_cov227-Chaetoceros_neogracile.AAC.9
MDSSKIVLCLRTLRATATAATASRHKTNQNNINQQPQRNPKNICDIPISAIVLSGTKEIR